MAVTRANSEGLGADLHLDHLELRGRHGLRASLMDALREAVRTGRLLPGAQLPSSRTLATDLSIARNTVADAYAELVAEGWLTARQGAGTRVARRAEPHRTPAIGSDRDEIRRPRVAGSACYPATRTWRASRVRSGSRRRGAHLRPRRTKHWATATREAVSSSARLSPNIWPAPAASTPPRTASWSARASSTGCA
jgi:DNA-binding transcriptional MocR family regulator